MIRFHIISTGSKGNAVLLDERILIDVGVPFKALRPYYRDVQLILLTHEHCDHFQPATVRRLIWERPTLRFGCCDWMARQLVDCGVDRRNIDLYAVNRAYQYGSAFSVEPFPLFHNVPNCGYRICFADGQRLLYATDTNSMTHVTAPGYDLYMLEANYTQKDILERIKQKQEQGLYCYEYDVLHNHLSREKAEQWLYANMGSHSRYVFLHGHEE